MSADADVLAELRALRADVADLARAWRAGPPRCLSIEDACRAFAVSRSTFEKWLADPSTGLDVVVLRPNGPGGRVLVPVEGFEAWLRSRSDAGPRVA